ncbi:MAG: type II toxin-antitoxin system HicA family toxin [Candidatus Diapherotrites archaeon]|nr:type II toxin-antitoxin system HicA family toxin [Candidatus Micrarchaeota archaeon]
MPETIKTNKLIRLLRRLGFQQIRQRGSHLFFKHNDGRTTLVPLHYEIRAKLLTKIIKQDLKMEKGEFFRKLK